MGQKSKQVNRADSSRRAVTQVLPYAVGVFGLAFIASCVTASITTPVQNSEATSGVSLDATAVPYYVNIASNNGSGGVVSKDIQATFAGSRGLVTDTLKVTSNTPNGYYIYLSMANTTNGQKLVNMSDSSYFLSPIDTGTYSMSNPGNLGAVNTWGVAVGDTYNASFDAASAYASDDSLTATTKFAPVPAYGAEELLITRTGSTVMPGAETDTSKATVDTIPVYYGFYANSALPSGTYQNTVLYTAYAEATDTPGGVATYTGDVDYKNGGNITFTTSLYTDREVATSDVVVKINGKTATVTSVSKVDAGNNDSVRIVVAAPTQDKPGVYDATIDIDKFAHHSATTIEYQTDGVTISGTNYKTMQSLPSGWCSSWANTPSAFTSGSGPTYTYNGADEPSAVLTNPDDYWDGRRSVRISNINADVPEVYLKDNRDGNYYRIRKFADGNCWMTENLRLVFSTDGALTVGKVASDGVTITATDTAITTDNTQVTSAQLANWQSIVAKTEVSGTLGSAHTVWGADSGAIHASSTSSITNNDDNSKLSAKYARSYYNATTKSDCANGLNDVTTSSSSNCFIGDNDEQTIGTYYNFTAATAGKGTEAMTTGSSTTDSICPKGWQLPTNTGTKSYTNLLVDTYGGGTWDASSNTDGVRWNRDSRSLTAGNRDAGDYHLWAMTAATRLAPFSLPFSGYYYYYSGAVDDVGYEGYWWSSTATSASKARFLHVLSGFFRPQANSYKGYGFTVRCVAQ